MANNIAESYWSASPEQRCMIDMVLAVNPDDMTDFQKNQFVRVAAAYAMVNLADMKPVTIDSNGKVSI